MDSRHDVTSSSIPITPPGIQTLGTTGGTMEIVKLKIVLKLKDPKAVLESELKELKIPINRKN